jgi:hypothetical protein
MKDPRAGGVLPYSLFGRRERTMAYATRLPKLVIKEPGLIVTRNVGKDGHEVIAWNYNPVLWSTAQLQGTGKSFGAWGTGWIEFWRRSLDDNPTAAKKKRRKRRKTA